MSNKNDSTAPPNALLSASAFVRQLHQINGRRASHYALAVSGGRDSMALVALAAKAQKLKTAPRFSVLSVNHGLRRAASEELNQVAQQCKKLNLAHFILQSRDKLPATGVQQAARELRYNLMGAWCKRHKAEALIVAHHQDDQAETILMRLARGSGVAGLAGMRPKQTLTTQKGALIVLRPFLETPRTALEKLVRAARLEWSDDPSNENTHYERVRWRKLMPALAEAGLTPAALTTLAREARRTSAFINEQAADWLAQHGDYHPLGFFTLARAPFAMLAPALQKRIVQALVQWLGDNAYPAPQTQIAQLLENLTTRPHGALTFGGCMLRWRKDTLTIGCEAAALKTLTQDRRFHIKPKKGEQIAPLGQAGAQALRAKTQNSPQIPKIPAAYLYALPALYRGKKLISCPPLRDRKTHRAAPNFYDILTQ